VPATLPFFIELLIRALRAFFVAIGTTALGFLLSTLWYSILVLVATHIVVWRRKGWGSMRKDFCKNLETAAIIFVFVIVAQYGPIFFYQLFHVVPRAIETEAAQQRVPSITPPKPGKGWDVKTSPKMTRREIAKFGYGVVVQISIWGVPPTTHQIESGFWVGTSGYVITCLHILEENIKSHEQLAVGSPLPPSFGKTVNIAGGSVITDAEIVSRDAVHDLALLYVENSPFRRKMHGVAASKDLKSNQIEDTEEVYWVPKLTKALPEPGDEIVRVSFTTNKVAVLNPGFGFVNRVGLNEKGTLNIFTSLPFSANDYGAPIIDNRKTVLGLIATIDNDNHFAVAIPARYIAEFIRKSKIEITKK
jgi:hypothetical protein